MLKINIWIHGIANSWIRSEDDSYQVSLNHDLGVKNGPSQGELDSIVQILGNKFRSC